MENTKSKIDTAASEHNRKRSGGDDSGLSNGRISTCLEEMGKAHLNRKSMAKFLLLKKRTDSKIASRRSLQERSMAGLRILLLLAVRAGYAESMQYHLGKAGHGTRSSHPSSGLASTCSRSFKRVALVSAVALTGKI